MPVAWKLALSVATVIVVMASLSVCSRMRREAALFEADLEQDTRVVGAAIASAVRLAAGAGEPAVRDVIAATESYEGGSVRWVWLDVPIGHPDAPRIPSVVLGRFERDRSLFWSVDGVASICNYTRVDLGARHGAVEVVETLQAEARYLDETLTRTTLTTGLQLALAVVCVLGMTSLLVGRPVARLVERARAIARGELGDRLNFRQRDEIGQLARQFDETAEQLRIARETIERETTARLHALEQLRHADRLATVGQLGAGIAHELGTPLGIIIGHAQMTMDDHPPSDPAHAHAEVIAQQARKAAAIIRQLLDFARRREPRRVNVDVRELLGRTLSMLGPLATKKQVELQLADGPPIEASVDAGQLQQAVANLLVNAIDATHRGRVTTSVNRGRARDPRTQHERACILITVEDTGTGMSPAVLERVFEPFFTTKGPGHGTGLGLAVAHGFASDHGGWIEGSSELGKGSVFVFAIPEVE